MVVSFQPNSFSSRPSQAGQAFHCEPERRGPSCSRFARLDAEEEC